MKTRISILLSGLLIALLFYQCVQQKEAAAAGTTEGDARAASAYGGFESQIKWGEHLVLIGVCNDCHTPKKITPTGPEPDMSLMLSGHPADIPLVEIDRKALGSKGYTARLKSGNAWIGSWGVSYAANLTPDDTGIGPWTEAQFFKAIREGKYKGLDGRYR